MKQVIVTEGPIFDKLMQMSAGKWMKVRLIVPQPVIYLPSEPSPGSDFKPVVYEEWEPGHTQDGSICWIRRGGW